MTTIVERRLLLLAGGIALVAGCASPRETATFVTKTSFSLIDIDSTPAGVAIAYDRIEGYLGPRYPDGKVFPVASALETRGTGFNRQIRQVYATGNAARTVTEQSNTPTCASPGETPDSPATKVMFFGTATTTGLKIGFDAGSPLPNSFALGYKRKEVSVIPVEPGHEPSVLGTFNNAAGVEMAQGGGNAQPEFDVEQYFATGKAAENLAMNDSIKARFSDNAARAMGDIGNYRVEEARQGRIALETLNCFTKLGDDKLDEVWINAEHLNIFDGRPTVTRIRAATPRQKQREIYVGELSLLIPDRAEYTTALTFHKNVVCKLSKSNP